MEDKTFLQVFLDQLLLYFVIFASTVVLCLILVVLHLIATCIGIGSGIAFTLIGSALIIAKVNSKKSN